MASSNQFNAFMASRGEGLHPRLRQLYERAAISPISEVTIRADGLLQAGPDPETEAAASHVHVTCTWIDERDR
jgi:hypothetical protein